MSENKVLKHHETEEVGDMIDGISNLPDCILHHIWSFMPTTEAVKASVLSTRWKSLWTSVPNLDFNDALMYASEVNGRHPPEVTSFMNFVERVLRLRDANVDKFRLSCRVCFDAYRIHSWISNAIMHNVRELDLCLFAEEPSVIPQSMFNAKSLVTLKIEMNCVINLPSHISFPRLKTLHLALVTFLNDDSTERLFLGCPVLEELVLLDCVWTNLKNVGISSSTLKSLTIDDLPYDGSEDDPSVCKIKIDAESLTYLEYSGYLLNEVLLENVSSLLKASIHIPIPCERRREGVNRAVGLLKGLKNIVSLRVSNRTMESLRCTDSHVKRFPVFSKLSHLELTMEIGNNTGVVLMDLLTFCPTLPSICFSEGFNSSMPLSEDGSDWLSMTRCMSYHLKTLTFKNFHGNDSEVYFLKCVLTHAWVLEKMDIWWCKTRQGDIKKQREVKKIGNG